jgi:hypothetical protein
MAKQQSKVNDVKSLAALVYDRGEEANGIVAAFAADLAHGGVRLGGFVQIVGAAEPELDKETHVLDLETGARFPIMQKLGPHSQSCRVDPMALVDIGQLVLQALSRKPELLIINRFGRLESEGKGLVDEIGAAALSGLPVLVGVASRYLDQWRSFALDLAEELDCSKEALEAWWDRVRVVRESAPI